MCRQPVLKLKALKVQPVSRASALSDGVAAGARAKPADADLEKAAIIRSAHERPDVLFEINRGTFPYVHPIRPQMRVLDAELCANLPAV